MMGIISFSTNWRAVCRTSFSSSLDRKSTRLNSSHSQISYAVFCLKKKKIVAVRTGNAGPVDFDGVVMKPFVHRPAVAQPAAVLCIHCRAAFHDILTVASGL